MKKRSKKSIIRDSAYMFALRKSIGQMSNEDLNMIKDLINVELATRNNELKEVK